MNVMLGVLKYGGGVHQNGYQPVIPEKAVVKWIQDAEVSSPEAAVK